MEQEFSNDPEKPYDIIRRMGGDKKVEDVREELFPSGIQVDRDDDRVDVYVRRCNQDDCELVFCTGNSSFSIINVDLKKLQAMGIWLRDWAKETRRIVREEISDDTL